MHFFCAGGVKVGKHAFFKCLGFHGSIGYYDAMAKSCNSFFYQLGRQVGPNALRKACLDVGLGEKQGIEIGGEAKGTVPTQEYMDKHPRLHGWHEGDTLNFSIGQGYVAATPLQLANLAALVANNGTNYVPHLLHQINSADGKTSGKPVDPQVLKHVTASADFWADLKKALVGVIDHGTAQGAKIPNVIWAGKTGSAEHGDKKEKTHAVFVGFAPADDPKIAICVLIEQVGHGGDFAAPPAKDIVEAYLAEGKSKGLAKSAASSSAKPAFAGSPTTR
jgi:penicillin-binding protein 2